MALYYNNLFNVCYLFFQKKKTFVGMQTGVASVEHSMDFPQNVKNETLI